MLRKKLADGEKLPVSWSIKGSGDEQFVPHEITVTGFCEYESMSDYGWTREMFAPVLTKLTHVLPADLRPCVDQTVRTIGYKNLKFAVDIRGNNAREIAQRWQEWLKSATAEDLTQCEDAQLQLDVSNIKVYCERKPSREANTDPQMLWPTLRSCDGEDQVTKRKQKRRAAWFSSHDVDF